MISIYKYWVICLVAILVPSAACSQEESKWEFNLAPLYLWAIAIDGDMGIRGRTTSVSVDFGDIWDNLEGVFTVRFNGLYGKKYGFVFDYNYLVLGTERASDMVNADVDFKSQIINLAGIYRFIDSDHTLDGVAGIRYTKLDSGVTLNNLGVNLDGNQDWVDPIVGLRYNYAFSDKWSLQLYGDIGGFGASSDFTWQGMALIDFQPWKNIAFVAGYRGIGTDYETGSGVDKFTYDTTVHGPLIGLDIRW
ncbi:MAG: hypothetical protein HKP41_03190 [Desulfobacterales bacterium]|nr:hypothetical protein [Desulfobacterales bacterium]